MSYFTSIFSEGTSAPENDARFIVQKGLSPVRYWHRRPGSNFPGPSRAQLKSCCDSFPLRRCSAREFITASGARERWGITRRPGSIGSLGYAPRRIPALALYTPLLGRLPDGQRTRRHSASLPSSAEGRRRRRVRSPISLMLNVRDSLRASKVHRIECCVS